MSTDPVILEVLAATRATGTVNMMSKRDVCHVVNQLAEIFDDSKFFFALDELKAMDGEEYIQALNDMADWIKD